jgi:H+-translocating NAD(P) transhydrogenase subunit alpha
LDIAVLRERHPHERRVALTPSHLPAFSKLGVGVRVEAGAGAAAGFPDDAYRDGGARVEADPASLVEGCRAVLKVRPPLRGVEGPLDEVALLPSGSVWISMLGPRPPEGLLEALAGRGVDALYLERLPRITRAQRMDVLSSQATAAGYRAVLRGASHLPRFLPMLTTAAGTVPPARVLVLGAGVAGLQAIATARRLGAAVTGYDVRPAAQEQIRSLGAKTLEEKEVAAEGEGGYARALSEDERERQLQLLGEAVPGFDMVITTAQIPGRPAPLLITTAMVEGMRAGSVIIDLAGETGGNCELTRFGELVEHRGVRIDAPENLPAELPWHASEMYGRNLIALLQHLIRDGELVVDPEDEITGAILVVHDGRVRDPNSGG